MVNPWFKLPSQSPYVLPQDWPVIERFNDDLPPSKSGCRVHVEGIIPEPFAGAVKTAPVVVLLLNPGFDETKLELHSKPEFQEALWANLRHEKTEWPFYFLDPQFDPCKGEYPGVDLWKKRTRKLAEEVGSRCPAISNAENAESAGLSILSERLAVVDWLPYRSHRFKQGRCCAVPSRDYGFSLVRDAILRNALLIIGRGHDLWKKSVPTLEQHDWVLTLSSVQNACLTRKNLVWWSEPKGDPWDVLLDALCHGRVGVPT